jgi:hypothetical protein
MAEAVEELNARNFFLFKIKCCVGKDMGYWGLGKMKVAVMQNLEF